MLFKDSWDVDDMSFNYIYERTHGEVETERLNSSSCCFVMLMLANDDNRADVFTFQLNLQRYYYITYFTYLQIFTNIKGERHQNNTS